MATLKKTFHHPKPVIGVIHLPPLPGSPSYKGQLEKVYQQAIREAELYNKYVDGIIVENFNDQPFFSG